MIAKAAGSNADHVFLDLEDACAPSEKARARKLVVSALRDHDFGTKVRAVRVNAVTTPWCHRDIVDVVTAAGADLDVLVVPKVEDASHVHFVDHLLTGIELELGEPIRIGLELQIESPRGAVNLRDIAGASSRIEAIAFGPGDYAASLGIAQHDIGTIDDRYPGHQWHWIMNEIVAHAQAAGAQAIDGPYVDFHDEAGFCESAQRAKLLGFDGKWCIHPDQIELANAVFQPTDEEITHAQRIVEAYADGAAAGRGAIAVDGKLVDEASRRVAEETLARARLA
jgi:citrate lyase subunit beta/citryl-CoA lyase